MPNEINRNSFQELHFCIELIESHSCYWLDVDLSYIPVEDILRFNFVVDLLVGVMLAV